eukprot:531241_1
MFIFLQDIHMLHQLVLVELMARAILGSADAAAQYLSTIYVDNYKYDVRRTMALSVFGFFYYGFVSRTIYWFYDIYFGPGKALTKTVVESLLHTYSIFIPSFYFITGTVKGYSVSEIKQQLKDEYFASAGGTMTYWLPLMYWNFKYCKLETRIFFVSTFS